MGNVYVLIGTKVKEVQQNQFHSYPPEIRASLKDFKELVSDESTKCLPPILCAGLTNSSLGTLPSILRDLGLFRSSRLKILAFPKQVEIKTCDAEFLPSFFSLKLKTSESNKVVDALSRRSLLLTVISTQVNGYEQLRNQYDAALSELNYKDHQE